MSPRVVSVVALTVERMTTTRIHTCIYFDDGGAEHRCACGSRAFYLVEEDGTDPVLVVLHDDAELPREAADRLVRELAISA
jgi:hypothetical protein